MYLTDVKEGENSSGLYFNSELDAFLNIIKM